MKLQRMYDQGAKVYFLVATISLIVIAFILLGTAAYNIIADLTDPEELSVSALGSVGLLIIGFAIVETSKFIAEEELFTDRELRSYSESRRSLTKFVTIIVIAASLEGLVMIFRASRTEVSDSYYGVMILFAAMFALVALGLYQWLSSRVVTDEQEAELKD
jgi:hypothetical protein